MNLTSLLVILPIKAFQDNYIWIFYDKDLKQATVVDPGDATPVIEFLKQHRVSLSCIFLTHHHADHSGGVSELLKIWPHALVYGSKQSEVPYLTHRVEEGDRVDCPPVAFNVLEIPGHTLDHLAFYNGDMLFCGDTLFSAGCGKVFEGTYAQMYESLMKLTVLPSHAKVYCGHEYTLKNLLFAQAVLPDHALLCEEIIQVRNLLSQNIPTLPSTVAKEKEINLFLRCQEPEVIKAVSAHYKQTFSNPIEIFKHLREWKNSF